MHTDKMLLSFFPIFFAVSLQLPTVTGQSKSVFPGRTKLNKQEQQHEKMIPLFGNREPASRRDSSSNNPVQKLKPVVPPSSNVNVDIGQTMFGSGNINGVNGLPVSGSRLPFSPISSRLNIDPFFNFGTHSDRPFNTQSQLLEILGLLKSQIRLYQTLVNSYIQIVNQCGQPSTPLQNQNPLPSDMVNFNLPNDFKGRPGSVVIDAQTGQVVGALPKHAVNDGNPFGQGSATSDSTTKSKDRTQNFNEYDKLSRLSSKNSNTFAPPAVVAEKTLNGSERAGGVISNQLWWLK